MNRNPPSLKIVGMAKCRPDRHRLAVRPEARVVRLRLQLTGSGVNGVRPCLLRPQWLRQLDQARRAGELGQESFGHFGAGVFAVVGNDFREFPLRVFGERVSHFSRARRRSIASSPGIHCAGDQQLCRHLMRIAKRKAVLAGQHGNGLVDDLCADGNVAFEYPNRLGGLFPVVGVGVDGDVRISERTHDGTTRRDPIGMAPSAPPKPAAACPAARPRRRSPWPPCRCDAHRSGEVRNSPRPARAMCCRMVGRCCRQIVARRRQRACALPSRSKAAAAARSDLHRHRQHRDMPGLIAVGAWPDHDLDVLIQRGQELHQLLD